MKEIELKILEIEPAQIAQKLLALGAKKTAERIIVEKYFDFEDRRISEKGEIFRLRKNGDTIELTYKDSRSGDTNYLISEETETEVKDFDIMEKILGKLGLLCKIHREKRRTSFERGSLKFEIDQYPEIPPYLEIEGEAKNIEEAVKALGFTMDHTINRTSTEVLRSYKVDPNFQKF